MRKDIDRTRHDPASLSIPGTDAFSVGQHDVDSTSTVQG